MREMIKFKLLLIVVVTLQCGMLGAQSKVVSNEKYYATSVYNFTRFVKWPESRTHQDFKIAVVGSESVFEELKKLTLNKKYGINRYQISYFKKYSDVSGYYHMVYLSSMNSGKINTIKKQTKSMYTMYITEREDMGAFGSAVSFYADETGRITFELTPENFTNQHLVLNSSLLSLAGKVSN